MTMRDNVVQPQQFQLEPDDDLIPTTKAAEKPAGPSAASVNLLLLALKTLTQRTVIALGKLFTLGTILTVFWLWMSVPEPNTHQLVGLGMYALFILTINFIVLRREP